MSYKRLKDSGYIPIKDYKRFVLFMNKNNGLRECLLWIDMSREERYKVLEILYD